MKWERTSKSSVDLLDVNVWIAIHSPDHVHHRRARRYWDNESADHVAFCRVTALAALRQWTNPAVMRHAVLTTSEAWEEFERWLALPDIVSLPEPTGLHATFRRFAMKLTLGHSSWTDAYLASFAIVEGCRLVTFDVGFRRYGGLDLLVLEP